MTVKMLFTASGLLLSSLVNAATLPRVSSRQIASNEPTCSDKDQGSTFSYTSSGSTYDVLCGKDYYGGDLRSMQTNTFGDCLSACNTESACVTVAFRDGACYLKSTVTSAVSDANVWSAKKSGAKSLSCDGKASDGATYTASKGQFKIICGQEYAGGDLTSTSTANFIPSLSQALSGQGLMISSSAWTRLLCRPGLGLGASQRSFRVLFNQEIMKGRGFCSEERGLRARFQKA